VRTARKILLGLLADLGGAGGSPLLTAPTLSWTSGTTDNTPDLSVTFPDILVTGTDVTFEYANNSGFTGATSVVHDLTSPEALAQEMELALSALADGTWYIRVKYEGSNWSNTETKTIDAAPTLTSPTGVKTGTTTATVGATTDQANGTLYWVVTTAINTPSAAQVKAGQDHAGAAATASGSQAISTTGVKTANVTGLSAGTSYYAHLMHEDAGAHQSGVVDSSSFTTDGSAYVGPGDVISGAVAWASPARAYNAAYIGSALMDLVDQAGANPITINCLASGFADVSAITAWVTANSVSTIRITKLYDQTGNGHHFTQVTVASMPSLTLSALNGLPAMTGASAVVFPTNNITQAQAFTLSYVAKRTGALTTEQNVLSIAGGTVMAGFSTTNNNGRMAAGNAIVAAASGSTFNAFATIFNGTSSTLVIDNSATTNGLSNPNALSATPLRALSANGSGAGLTGQVMEVALYPGAWNATQYGNMNTNQHGANGYNF
jgi:hypothetical protein